MLFTEESRRSTGRAYWLEIGMFATLCVLFQDVAERFVDARGLLMRYFLLGACFILSMTVVELVTGWLQGRAARDKPLAKPRERGAS